MTERNPPNRGGCWICQRGNGYEDDDMAFDMAFDTFYHPDCLKLEGCETITEYERNRESEHSIEWGNQS